MKKQAILVLAILGVVALSGAKSTKLIFTWKNPSYASASFKNILLLAMNGKASSRADFEDQMVTGTRRPGIQAVPSYLLMPRIEVSEKFVSFLEVAFLRGIGPENVSTICVDPKAKQELSKTNEVPNP